MCVLECIRQCVCVCVCVCLCVCVSGSVCVSWNGVEEPGRGTELRDEGRGRESRDGVESRGRGSRDGECVSELESEYERVRARELI